MPDLKIQVSQINPTLGDFENNYDKIINEIINAKEKNVDLVVFPELSLCGSPQKDLIKDNSFIKKCSEYIDKIAEQSKDIGLIIGSIAEINQNLYNTIYLIDNTRIIDTITKIISTRTSVFDEKTYFSTGDGFKIFRKNKIPYMIVSGNDIGIITKFSKVAITPEEPVVIINPIAIPYEMFQLSYYYENFSKISEDWRWHYIRSNLVGGQDEIIYFGGSFAWDKNNGLTEKAPYFKEGSFIVEIKEKDNDYKLKNLSTSNPLKEKGIGEIYDALVLSVKDYVRKNKFEKVLVGISGGIDSALTAMIAIDALGPENVIGVFMPSRYTSRESHNDVDAFIKNTKIRNLIIQIDTHYKNLKDELSNIINQQLDDITDQNIQARLRAIILMALTNQFKRTIVLNTGNKSERMVGYCTLYGDSIGGFAPLCDVYKTTVWELAEYRNKYDDKPIPENIINKTPSAELKENQKDSDDLPEYKTLDKILKAYIEENMDIENIIRSGINRDTLKSVVQMVFKSQFKREQAPIGPVLKPYNTKNLENLPITNLFKLD
jgi:NAD+ synthase (glutamine-hydrolysing)